MQGELPPPAPAAKRGLGKIAAALNKKNSDGTPRVEAIEGAEGEDGQMVLATPKSVNAPKSKDTVFDIGNRKYIGTVSCSRAGVGMS